MADENRCPCCGNVADVDYEEIRWNGEGTITFLWYCTACKKQWDDVYRFVRREKIKDLPEMSCILSIRCGNGG